MNPDTIHTLTLNAYHECRGEPSEGIKAVTKVVLNRAYRRRQTIRQVVYAPRQFSWTEDEIPNDVIKELDAYRKCRLLVLEAIDEFINGDTLHRADHYFNFNQVNPPWAARMTEVARIGRHAFYRS